MHFLGTSGDDDFSGTSGRDTFDMSQGGNDTVFGQGGKDFIYFGAAFTADDVIDGGVLTVHQKIKVLATVELQGDYSAGVVFGATTMTNVAHLVLDAGFSYNFTLNDTTIASGRKMAIDARGLGAGDSLVIDNSAATDGVLNITTNAGHVDLVGGSGSDNYALGATLDQNDRIDGGTGNGNNALLLKGDYSGTLTLDASWISNITTIKLGTGHYDFVANDSFATRSVTVDGGTHAHANFDASAETSAAYWFQDLTGVVKGGGGGDTFAFLKGSAYGNGGNDHFTIITGKAYGGDGDDSFSLIHGKISGGAGNDVYFNSTGVFDSGAGNDTFTDCSGTFHLEHADVVHVRPDHTDGEGDDTFYLGSRYTASDSIDGGDGDDVAYFKGDYSAGVVLGSNFLVDKLVLAQGHDYHLTVDHMFDKGGGTFTVDGSALVASDALDFDASLARSGRYVATGGAGDDTLAGDAHDDVLTGGAGDDVIRGYDGANTVTGGAGADSLFSSNGRLGQDTFVYGSAQDSTGTHHDTITGFDTTYDAFKVAVAVTGVDHALTGGTLDSGNFDTDLAVALNGHLMQNHAIVFTADQGDLAGDVFLVVDQNGVAGYQTGADLVIRLDGGNDVQDINLGNFH